MSIFGTSAAADDVKREREARMNDPLQRPKVQLGLQTRLHDKGYHLCYYIRSDMCKVISRCKRERVGGR